MTQLLKDELQTLLSGLVTSDIVVASTYVAALLGGDSIRGSDDRHVVGRLTIPEYGDSRPKQGVDPASALNRRVEVQLVVATQLPTAN
ncbi:hypothetical protein PII47_07375 [Pseudomonas sp. 21TX0197]|uniref:hypothetical protein n=1 Tax=unclassified Pseudomonas TaxID=196821 RepID=UPI0007E372E5|nr:MULTISPECIES: hypothetical protein [unclassified Pseudomonas]MDB6443199.1 hypothetical protein [Pseudomonas sp. 21TX0197]